jgi:hypothetical protein
MAAVMEPEARAMLGAASAPAMPARKRRLEAMGILLKVYGVD